LQFPEPRTSRSSSAKQQQQQHIQTKRSVTIYPTTRNNAIAYQQKKKQHYTLPYLQLDTLLFRYDDFVNNECLDILHEVFLDVGTTFDD
jgi:hypothetical protein